MIIIWLSCLCGLCARVCGCCGKLNEEETNDEQTENNEERNIPETRLSELNYNQNKLNYLNNLGLKNPQSLV